LFSLKIIYDYKIRECEIVDVKKVNIWDIPIIKEDDIWEYNDLFSKVIADNKSSMEYLISPTLSRNEGVTLFYDKVCRFIYCLEYVKKAKWNIVFRNLDYTVAKALIKQLSDKKLKIQYNAYGLILFNISSYVKFIINTALTISTKFIYLIACRFFINRQKNLVYDYGFYTFYDQRSYKNGSHREEYFDPLLKLLIKKKKEFIVFNYPLDGGRIPLFLKYLLQISNTPGDRGYVNTVFYRFLDPRDIFASLYLGIFKRPKVNQKIVFKDYDISFLVNLSLRRDFYSLVWFNTYLTYLFAKKIFKLFSIRKIFYCYENHPWEKALVLARNEVSSLSKLIAFQHASFSYKLLQQFPTEFEKGIPCLPDKILTAGKILKNILEKRGCFPPGLIQEGCALRHLYLFEGIKVSILEEKYRAKSKKIVYAFSVDFKNYETILENLAKIFNDKMYTVYLKFHPDILSQIGFKNRLPANFIDARYYPWDKLLRETDILLYDDNTLAIEALRYNITIGYFALTGQIYNTDRLFDYHGEKIIVNSIEKFREFLDNYYQNGHHLSLSTVAQNYDRSYLEEYFSPVTEGNLTRFL